MSSKFAQGAAREVQRDLAETPARAVAVSYRQRLSEAMGTVVQAQEADWEYALAEPAVPIARVAVGLDGTCLLCEDGGRAARVGTLALGAADGERQHTLYRAAAPESGKQSFLARLERELQRVKAAYPQAPYRGLAEGAQSTWRFLTSRTTVQLSDFYPARGYLQTGAEAALPKAQDQAHRHQGLQDRCHRLKHAPGAAQTLLEEIKALPTAELNTRQHEPLPSAITYFVHHHPMDYAPALANPWPIGSGVTEAACKTLVKQRLCRSGMRWKETVAAVVLSLRALLLTPDRWRQVWDTLDRVGFPVATS